MNNTIPILSGLVISLLVALFFVYLDPKCPQQLQHMVTYAFNGFSGALLLALRTKCSVCSDKPKEPTDAKN